jgi:protease-4
MSSGPSSSASQPPATQTTPPWNYNGPPIQVVVQSGSTLGRIATRVVLGFAVLAVVVLLMVVIGQRVQYHEYFQTGAGVREKYHSGSQESRNKIAVIRIEGVIVSGDGYVRDQIDRVRDDENVRALVVRVDSPGGTVTGSHYIYHHLRELIAAKEAELGAGEFPVLVSMGSIAASGGYYVSMAVGPQKDAIFAEPTTTTGSIGVILPHYNLGGLMQQYGVESDAVASR